MKIENIAGVLGAEVHDIDLIDPLSIDEIAELRLALALRGALVFRNLALDSEQHVRFISQFGVPERFPDQTAMGNPNRNIFQVSNRGDGYNVGHYWHMDASVRPRPTAYSTLYAVDVPDNPATRTSFLSAGAAYDALDSEMKQRLVGLRWKLASGVLAPVLRSHAVTGLPLLWLPMRFPLKAGESDELRREFARLNQDIRPQIDGYVEAESEDLLFQLLRHITGDETWQHHHAWRTQDLVMWDQSSAYHHAGFSESRRVLRRAAVPGVPALAFTG